MSLDTNRVVHLPPPLISRVSLALRHARKGEQWKITIPVAASADEGWTDQQICAAFDVSRNTSIRVRQLYLAGGLAAHLIYTPKHGSWLNMAEIEISIFARGCLSRRVASMQDLRQRIATLEAERNARHCTISWRFTSHDARDKLHDLYPVINNQLD